MKGEHTKHGQEEWEYSETKGNTQNENCDLKSHCNKNNVDFHNKKVV
jgi:hypothetical protein